MWAKRGLNRGGGDPSRELELRAQIWANMRGSGPRQELPGAGGCSLGAGRRAKPAHLEQLGAGVAKGWLSRSSPTTLCHGDCWETPKPPAAEGSGPAADADRSLDGLHGSVPQAERTHPRALPCFWCRGAPGPLLSPRCGTCASQEPRPQI